MGMASLIVAYCTDEDSSGIKSLTEEPLGYDKWWISLNSLGVFLGIMPTGEVRKLGKGGASKGPTTLPASISFFNFANATSGLRSALCKLGDSK